LIAEGVDFLSQTDTEVIVHLIHKALMSGATLLGGSPTDNYPAQRRLRDSRCRYRTRGRSDRCTRRQPIGIGCGQWRDLCRIRHTRPASGYRYIRLP
jgi:hypothetical protein